MFYLLLVINCLFLDRRFVFERTENGFGIIEVSFQKQGDSLGQTFLGRIRGFGQVTTCLVDTAQLQRRVGGVQVRHRIVREHTDSYFEHFAEGVTARFVGLRHLEHFVQAQLLRVAIKQLFRLVGREVANLILHHIVRMAQSRIDRLQYISVRSTARHLSQLPFLFVQILWFVGTDDSEQFVFRFDIDRLEAFFRPAQSSGSKSIIIFALPKSYSPCT